MSIKQDIRSLKWRRWLQRKFSPMMISIFRDGCRKKYFEKIGANGVDCKAALHQNGYWYESDEVWQDMVKKLDVLLMKKSIFDITESLEEFYKKSKRRVIELAGQEGDPKEQLKEVYDMFSTNIAFIWIAHGFEELYNIRLKKEVPKYIKDDIEKFIGDASLPKKKNKHAMMEETIIEGDDPKKIAEKYGWIRLRDALSEPFTEKDIIILSKEMKPKEKRRSVKIPKEMRGLFEEVQELVFFRTERTDCLYELIFLARPIIKRAGELYKIPYSELENYTIQSLFEGKPEKHSRKMCLAVFEDKYYIGEEPILKEEDVKEADSIKGATAYMGIVKGAAKVVISVSDLDKVKKGDILVTQMTFPSFITAMTRAAAFVTDEGGITCHAAIVAREMKKPCITGTKIATKIFKDGDIIEVDANKGIVKIIKHEGG